MKVKELLEELQKADPESELSFMMDDGCCGDWLDLEAYEAETVDFDKYPKYTRIRFNSIPGYSSCIQSGQTKKADKEYWENTKKF